MQPAPLEPGNVGFRCPRCGVLFREYRELQLHLARVHPARPSIPRCEACRQEFETPAELKAHNQAVHGAPFD